MNIVPKNTRMLHPAFQVLAIECWEAAPLAAEDRSVIERRPQPREVMYKRLVA